MITTRLLTSIRCRRNACQRFMSSTRAFSLETKLPAQSLINKTIEKISVNSKSPTGLCSIQTIRYNSTSNPKSAKERIDDLLNKSEKKVFVFMKGVPEQPACGYSNAVVQILNAYEVDYDSFDVLKDDEIRQEIKVYSNWPTIPQVYVDKNFIGGCDILIQMHQSEELEQLFEKTKTST